MSKRLIILIILILLLITGGVLWWWENGKEILKEPEKSEVETGIYKYFEQHPYIKLPPPIQKEELVFDYETGTEIVKDAVLIVFKEDVSEKIIKEKVGFINGEIIGYDKEINKYDVRIKNNPSLKELKRIIQQLKEDLDIRIATVELPCSVLEQFILPNDSRMGSWNESNPSGKNWGLEAIYAPSVWNYNDSLAKVKIGIIDKGGFFIYHEDLKITVANANILHGDISEFPYYASENNKEKENMNHGTHVAGIIGAISNNKVGITGTVWNKELFGFNITDSFRGGNVVNGIEYLINKGVGPINISLGWPLELEAKIIEEHQEAYNLKLKKLTADHDFLIIQAAGNEEADAKRHVLFNPLLKEEYEDLKKIIVTVGAIENDNRNYEMAWFGTKKGQVHASNYGDLIDVVAPGKEIYSTFWNEDVGIAWWKFWGKEAPFTVCFDWWNDSYGCMQGTSMAAPFVTGVAGLVWGANTDLTAEQVKEIIVNSADRPIVYKDKEYRILNAKKSVEFALRGKKKFTEQKKEEILKENKAVPNKLTAYVVDQYGEPFAGAAFEVFQSKKTEEYGYESYEYCNPNEKAFNVFPYLWSKNKLGSYYLYTEVGPYPNPKPFLQCSDRTTKEGWLETVAVEQGYYSLYLAAYEDYPCAYIDEPDYPFVRAFNKENIQLSKEGVFLDQIQLERGWRIKANFFDNNKTINSGNIFIEIKQLNGEWQILCSNVATCFECISGPDSDGYFESWRLKDGDYSVRIKDDYGQEAKILFQKDIRINKADISLGKIIIPLHK